MIRHYLETRGRVSALPSNIIADIMRHFHARQHLGSAVVVCDNPSESLQLGEKQWLRLARSLQRRRAMITHAVEILKLTYTITQMQHMKMTTDLPREQPDASLFFVSSYQLKSIPTGCMTVYLMSKVDDKSMAGLLKHLPTASLVVDYMEQLEAGDFGLKKKQDLEAEVANCWHKIERFLERLDIQIERLVGPGHTEEVDDAVDILLESDVEFLLLASDFQHVLNLARPLRLASKAQKDRYEALLGLAHRVRTLCPGGFSPQFLSTYADDTFFLNDRPRSMDTIVREIERQQAAGRLNIVWALLRKRLVMRQEGFWCREMNRLCREPLTTQ